MFYLERSLADEMVAHALEETPLECCGLLAGPKGKALRLYRARNAEASPTRYNVDPKELLHILREIDDKGWEVVGIYHSHTHSEAYPSATDVELAFWPDSLYFIVSLKDPHRPQIRAFSIVDGKIEEEGLKIG